MKASPSAGQLDQLNAAVQLHRAGRLSQAAALYTNVLNQDPDNADALHLLGLVARDVGRLDEALDLVHRAIERDGQQSTFWNSLGTLLADRGRTAEAQQCFARALGLDPRLAEAHYNRANLLRKSGDVSEAIGALRTALDIRPDYPDAHNDLGGVLLEEGDVDQAYCHVARALALRPDSAQSHANFGLVLAARLEYAKARQHLETAVELDPANGHARWCRAVAMLRSGDLEHGWAEFEWRWKSGQLQYPDRPIPAWSGEPLGEKRLLLWAEQGFGDTLQFVRYVRLLGANEVLEVQPELRALVSQSFPGVQVVAQGQTLPEHDVHAPLMSLPYLMGTRIGSIPGDVPYLQADPSRVGEWARRLGPRDGRRRIGLVWSGSQKHRNNKRRSLDPDLLEPLAGVTGIHWISLQKDAAKLPPLELTDLTSGLTDFAETAALLMNLDLLITVDTSVAHVAGALALPVWILAASPSCWRWLLDRTDTPWYPSARLYRQPRPGDWPAVIERVTADLK
jgi:tetratricopeptide (TPR) repeat protein